MSDSLCSPLTRDEVTRVIEGRGCASRVPVFLHLWLNPGAFDSEQKQDAVRALMDTYPCDAQVIPCRMPDISIPPEDDPGYRWMHCDAPTSQEVTGIDAKTPLADWDMLDQVIADFPSAEYSDLFPAKPLSDGRYRIANWYYLLFERFWSLRGMSNALMDFYTDPDEVHRLFVALTDFYIRVIERAKEEVGADAIFTSDDLGTQTGLFFSPQIYDEFFAPYYARIIKRTHELGMHFWLHICGNVTALLPKFIDIGLDVIHPIQKYAMDETVVAAQFGGKISFWAGFDVQRIIPWGTPEEVRQEVRHLFDTYQRSDGRLLFTAGNGITGDTPIASLEALFDEAYTYGSVVARTCKD